MDLSKFTEKSQAALMEAQNIATRNQHQAVDVEHLLLALLEQEGGLIPRLFERARVNPELIKAKVEEELARLPRVSGTDVTRQGIYITQRLNRLLVTARDHARRMKDEYVSVEHLVLAMFDEPAGTGIGKIFKNLGLTREDFPQGPHRGSRQPARHQRQSRSHLRGAREVRARPHPAGRAEQARPGHRPRRRDPALHPDPLPPDQEQPGPDR